mmetsp:Transcript_39951/g.56300  ORF Transcript_39951/g.56300 Transcript_39951/m.56300 type:complete len:117 (+) Transcript_39951:21-371(+)
MKEEQQEKTSTSWGYLCSIFSAIGVLFLLMIGMMLKLQPFLIGGIDDYRLARKSAFGAMWAYVFTFAIALFFACRDAGRKRRDIIIARSMFGQVPQLENDFRDRGSVDEEAHGLLG